MLFVDGGGGGRPGPWIETVASLSRVRGWAMGANRDRVPRACLANHAAGEEPSYLLNYSR